MNLPNKLTLSRFALTAFFLAAMFAHSAFNDTLALVLFSLGALTDHLDGRIARSRKLITNFGILMDPLADKMLVCSAFIALIERHMITPPPEVLVGHFMLMRPKVEAWMVIIIVARELAVTGMRLLAASRNVVLSAEGFGKLKTVSQIVAIIALLVLNSYDEWGAWSGPVFRPWLPSFAVAALWLSVLLTLTSGFLYLWRNREMYLHDM